MRSSSLRSKFAKLASSISARPIFQGCELTINKGEFINLVETANIATDIPLTNGTFENQSNSQPFNVDKTNGEYKLFEKTAKSFTEIASDLGTKLSIDVTSSGKVVRVNGLHKIN